MQAFVDPTPVINERVATATAKLRAEFEEAVDENERARLEREIDEVTLEISTGLRGPHIAW